jgi:hypothetical protein
MNAANNQKMGMNGTSFCLRFQMKSTSNVGMAKYAPEIAISDPM